MDEDPCDYEDGMKYYKCVDVPYMQLSERTLGKLPELEESLQAAHKRGMNEIWSALKWMWEHGTININWSAEKILEKYKEQNDAIKVGDEVRLNHDDTRAVVMDMSDQEDAWWVYTENGCIEEWHSSKFRKSGRTFPQIAEVLKAMQEGTES